MTGATIGDVGKAFACGIADLVDRRALAREPVSLTVQSRAERLGSKRDEVRPFDPLAAKGFVVKKQQVTLVVDRVHLHRDLLDPRGHPPRVLDEEADAGARTLHHRREFHAEERTRTGLYRRRRERQSERRYRQARASRDICPPVPEQQSNDVVPARHDTLSLSDFGYAFPESLVAQTPLAARDAARLLVRAPDGSLRHCHVGDLTLELPRGTLLILNETRVFPSRLAGRLESGGKVEIFLIHELNADPSGSVWSALARPMKKLKPGTTVHFEGDLSATVVARNEDAAGTPSIDVRFAIAPAALARWLDEQAFIPLPPYIKRPSPVRAPLSPDREAYQTVFARERGSVAAPTAGLHFTDALLDALSAQGVEIAKVALHVGAGTFLPVKSEDVTAHKMHAESYRVSRNTVDAILKARREGRKIVAVGTTSLRSLESLYREAGQDPSRMAELADSWRTTELFLRPEHQDDRYRPWVIDGLVTNFHQPHSTLFMLVSALLGLDTVKALYEEAVSRRYRLFSYGDASLLWV